MADIDAPMGKGFPLTRLIIDLFTASMSRRLAADPERVARKYGVSLEHARFYIGEARRCNDTWPIKERRDGKKR